MAKQVQQSYVGYMGSARIFVEPTDGGWRAYVVVPDQPPVDLGLHTTAKEARTTGEKISGDLLNKRGEAWTGSIVWLSHKSHRELIEQEDAGNQSRRTRIQQWLTIVIGVTAVLAAFIIQFPTTFNSRARTEDSARLQTLENDLKLQEVLLNSVNKQLIEMKVNAAASPPFLQAIASVQAEINTFKDHLASYEAALGDDPVRRLAVPLLRKDLDTLRDEHKSDITAMHEEFTRTFDLMKWLLGIVGVGTLLSSVSAWFPRSRST